MTHENHHLQYTKRSQNAGIQGNTDFNDGLTSYLQYLSAWSSQAEDAETLRPLDSLLGQMLINPTRNRTRSSVRLLLTWTLPLLDREIRR